MEHTHVATGLPGFVHHLPCTPVPGLGEIESVDGRGPLLVVAFGEDDQYVVPARSVAPSVHTTVKRITDCGGCAELLYGLLGNNNLHSLAHYFALTSEGSTQ